MFSPRTWGCFLATKATVEEVAVFPTDVGVRWFGVSRCAKKPSGRMCFLPEGFFMQWSAPFLRYRGTVAAGTAAITTSGTNLFYKDKYEEIYKKIYVEPI